MLSLAVFLLSLLLLLAGFGESRDRNDVDSDESSIIQKLITIKNLGDRRFDEDFPYYYYNIFFCFITGCWNLLSKLKRHRFDWNWRQWKPERKMLLLDQDDTTAKNQKKICFTENFFSHLIIHNNFLHLNIFFFLVVVYNKTKMSASVM